MSDEMLFAVGGFCFGVALISLSQIITAAADDHPTLAAAAFAWCCRTSGLLVGLFFAVKFVKWSWSA